MPESEVAVEGLWQEPRLCARGVPHGLTKAALGDMKRPARRAEVLARAGLSAPLTLLQNHGIRVHEARPGGDYALPSGGARLEGDGWITDAPGLPVAVYVADCLPILVWEDEGLSAVGAFHAGWRGLAAGMPRAAVQAFSRRGFAPDRLSAAVGPHAGACCYRVGHELREHFPPDSFHEEGGLRLDLGAEARRQLEAAGVPAERISVAEECTICGEGYHSFRRDKRDLRMLAFIAVPGERPA